MCREKVLPDVHLAELYGVETRALKQAVKRNPDRFPDDFMFQLSDEEVEEVVSQSVIPSKSHLGGALPFAFTENGVAMLSSILKSKKAIAVNIAIMRTFVAVRKWAHNYDELLLRIKALEKSNETQFKTIFQVLNKLMQPENKRQPIGFKTDRK